MQHFMVIGADIQPFDGPTITAPEVYELMMDHKCWEFTATAPHLSKMKKGDLLLFYLGGNHAKYFAGEAVVAGDFEALDDKSGGAFDREQIPFFAWRAPLKKIRKYPPHRAGLDDMMKLSFVHERVTRPYVGLMLRVGVRKITAEDAAVLQEAVGLAAR